MSNKKNSNVRNVNRWTGYYVEDFECTLCLYYPCKKRSCGYDICPYEDERRDAEAHGRIKRKRGFNTWDG